MNLFRVDCLVHLNKSLTVSAEDDKQAAAKVEYIIRDLFRDDLGEATVEAVVVDQLDQKGLYNEDYSVTY